MSLSDPSQSDNEKRLFLALILSTLVLLATSPLVNFFSPPEPPEQGYVEELAVPPTPPRAVEPPPSTPLAPFSVEGEIVGEMREFEVVNQDMVLRFSTRGAVVESIRLPWYRDVPRDGPGFPRSLALLWRWSRPEGEPLELLPQTELGGLPRPLAITTPQPELQARLDQAVYHVEGVHSRSLVQAPAEIRFLYQQGSLRVEREVRIPATGYELEATTKVFTAGRRIPAMVSVGAGMGPPEMAATSDFASPNIAVGRGLVVERVYEDDLAAEVTVDGADWVALDSQYFARAILGQPLATIQMMAHTLAGVVGDEQVVLLSARARANGELPLRVYFGPKNLEVLRTVSPGLGELVDYGLLSFLVKPLLWMLKWIHGLVSNYGVAIILLTFLINLALVPIRYKQIVSMKKMTELQPQLKAIQSRYKDLPKSDPKRQDMNKQVMALYQEHGVNPLGSCLPLLLQMPFLFAFYTMLWTSIELRGEPFLWIGDLSRYDLTFVTPILMGATMLAQQIMTPGGGDPAQRKMMMMMPVVFTALFLKVSSGLALYFLFSNVFGMLFQVIVQRVSPELSKQVPKQSSTPKRNSRGRKSKNR